MVYHWRLYYFCGEALIGIVGFDQRREPHSESTCIFAGGSNSKNFHISSLDLHALISSPAKAKRSFNHSHSICSSKCHDIEQQHDGQDKVKSSWSGGCCRFIRSSTVFLGDRIHDKWVVAVKRVPTTGRIHWLILHFQSAAPVVDTTPLEQGGGVSRSRTVGGRLQCRLDCPEYFHGRCLAPSSLDMSPTRRWL